MQKTTKKKIAPVVITVIVVLVMAPWAMLTLSALLMVVRADFIAALALLPFGILGGAVAVGLVKALLQRLEEIDGGEEEEASRY